MTKVVVGSEVEVARVFEWRVQWLRAGGYSKKNAELIAKTPLDWRYANEILEACKSKGYDEKFVMDLIL